MIIEKTLDQVYTLFSERRPYGFYSISWKDHMNFDQYIASQLVIDVRQKYKVNIQGVKII